jgi:methyl-accepting chemotaxis protein
MISGVRTDVRHAQLRIAMYEPETTDVDAADLERGNSPLLPIWAKQIETARRQTEEAIVALSGRFAAIVERIDSALGATTKETSR